MRQGAVDFLSVKTLDVLIINKTIIYYVIFFWGVSTYMF